MGRSAIAAILAATVVFTGCIRPPRQQVFHGITPAPERVFETWIAKNCNVGDDKDLEAYMRKFGAEITPRLIQAFTNGPEEPAVAAVRTRAYEELDAVQKRAETLELTPADAAKIREIDKSAAGDRAAQDFVRAYKSTALAGLGVVRTPEATARLQQEAADQQSGFHDLAATILSRVKLKPGKTGPPPPPEKR